MRGESGNLRVRGADISLPTLVGSLFTWPREERKNLWTRVHLPGSLCTEGKGFIQLVCIISTRGYFTSLSYCSHKFFRQELIPVCKWPALNFFIAKFDAHNHRYQKWRKYLGGFQNLYRPCNVV